MEFWLKNEGKKIDMLLPITPKSYDIDYGMGVETVGATAIGDINILTYRKLMSITLDGIFSVNETYHFLNKKTCKADCSMDYVNIVKGWIDAKDLTRLIIIDGTQTKINTLFYVEAIKYSEDNTSNKDINYSIGLREYRQLKATTVTNTNVNKERDTVVKAIATNRTYTVVWGDCLWNIARKFYGDGTKYTVIKNANNVPSNNLILPGQILIIP